MTGVHKLEKKEFHPGSFKDYQYYRKCSCGWECRLGSEQTADSQFAGHQQNHNYADPSKEEQNESRNTQEVEAMKKGSGIRVIGGTQGQTGQVIPQKTT